MLSIVTAVAQAIAVTESKHPYIRLTHLEVGRGVGMLRLRMTSASRRSFFAQHDKCLVFRKRR